MLKNGSNLVTSLLSTIWSYAEWCWFSNFDFLNDSFYVLHTNIYYFIRHYFTKILIFQAFSLKHYYELFNQVGQRIHSSLWSGKKDTSCKQQCNKCLKLLYNTDGSPNPSLSPAWAWPGARPFLQCSRSGSTFSEGPRLVLYFLWRAQKIGWYMYLT